MDQQLARGCLGTGEAGGRRKSHLQDQIEASTDPPAGTRSSLNSAGQVNGGDSKRWRSCRNISMGNITRKGILVQRPRRRAWSL